MNSTGNAKTGIVPRMLTKNLIRLVPDNAEYYYLLGIVQRELGKQKEALSSLKYATGLMPGSYSRASAAWHQFMMPRVRPKMLSSAV